MKVVQHFFGAQVMRLCALALFAVLAGCGSRGLPPAPVTAGVGDYNYVIGAGDSLNITVWRNPELSMAVPVRPDGTFDDRMGEFAGKHVREADARVIEALDERGRVFRSAR